MLTKLLIENVALIDKLEIDLGPGLNILTGETGAGKSIVVDSISAVIGGRLSKDIIRTGTEKAVIEGLFIVNSEERRVELEEYGFEIEEDNTLLVEREFYQNGRNICRVNGKLVTVSMLKYIGEVLVDIHGQHDSQSLTEQSKHIEFLDWFIGEDFPAMKEEYVKKFNKYKKLKEELDELLGDPEERLRRVDLLNFQINEIESVKLKKNEEAELTKKRLELANSEKVTKSLSYSYEALAGEGVEAATILSGINEVVKELNQISFVDKRYSDAASRLQECTYILEEISSEIRGWRDGVESNPQLLEQIEERLDTIARLKRKYGKDTETILGYLKKIKGELDELVNSEERVKKLTEKAEALKQEVLTIAKNMSMGRKEFSTQLEEKIEKELEELEMKNTTFIVRVDFWDELKEGPPPFNQNGLDRVEFLISPNVGEDAKPISKIASGGELSRIMLAIKTILAKMDGKSTLIFDEIDTGISGKTAQAVAEKLAYVSSNHQAICVTHLPQIAAMADLHYDVEKVVEGERTYTRINLVSGEDTYRVLARLLGGTNISDVTLEHAREIKANADKLKHERRSM